MATGASGHSGLILTRSRPLRLLTLLLFYFTQGFPVGLFFYAVPAWMGANGAGTGEIASVVGASALPWSLKLVNGFVIDRYTFLPMGRRRAWIIGAQSTIVIVLIAGALLAPAHSDVFWLSAIGFGANMAVTVQDVGIDSLAVDIMPEDERARAAGIMFGAQLLGMAAATALGGAVLASMGITACLLAAAVVPGAVALYGVAIREREGERRLPWGAGESHARNREIQIEAWRPLLSSALRAMILPLSLLLIPVLLVRSLPLGGFESFHPVLFTQTGGWQLTEYTSFTSTLNMISGIVGLVIGGWLVDAVGAQRSMLIAVMAGVLLLGGMALAEPLWDESWLLMSFAISMEIVGLFYAIAMIPLCMRMCTPAVAATQFTVYMAVGNFGRPLGAALAAATAGSGLPAWLYWSLAIAWLAALGILLAARFPTEDRPFGAAGQLPFGEGPAPLRD